MRRGFQPLTDAGWISLVDTPPALWSAEAMTLAAAADATLLVTRVRNSRWSAMEHVAEALRRDGVRAIGVVLVGTRRSLSSLSIRGGYGYGTGRADRRQTALPPRSGLPSREGGSRLNAEPMTGNGHRLEPRGNTHDPSRQPQPAPERTPRSP